LTVGVSPEVAMQARHAAMRMEAGSSSDDEPEVPDHGELANPQDFEEDTYSMVACSIVRDMHFMRKGHKGALRGVRLFTTIFCLVVTLFLQVYLITRIKKYVTAKAVHDVRDVYGTFETKMYAASGLVKTVNGNNRANGVTPLLKDHFASLSSDEQETVCTIPFSKPYFLATILFIWTLRCMDSLKSVFHLFIGLLWQTRKATDMGHAFDVPPLEKCRDVDELEVFQSLHDGLDDGTVILMQMSMMAKVLIAFLVLIPRMIIASVLLWLGCRWLTATTDFGDLILNAVALEFILQLKDMIYVTLVPLRCKNDLSKTKMMPVRRYLDIGWRALGAMFMLLCLAALWVYLYMFHFQSVLPGYHWDVSEICSKFIADRYSV